MTSVLTDQGHDMNPLWGAPRIHGELLKFSINVGLTSVAMYMARRRSLPSQGRKPFLRNHADGIASIDQFVLPTLSFRLLYGLAHSMPRPAPNLYCWVTAHPAVEWIARQLTEILRLGTPTEVIVRDRGRVYGEFFTRGFALSAIKSAEVTAARCWSSNLRGAMIAVDGLEALRRCESLT